MVFTRADRMASLDHYSEKAKKAIYGRFPSMDRGSLLIGMPGNRPRFIGPSSPVRMIF
jgi:hypothetical protein